jgi:hypothetical protein
MKRIIACTSLMTLGLLLIVVCCYFNTHIVFFYISLLASISIGASCALGESTLLGFLKEFPGETVGYYASGTGFAGIFASSTIILLTAAGL